MEKEKLRQIIIDQQEIFKKTADLIDRDIELGNFLKGNEIVVISGIRRCGKSSLLKLIKKHIRGDAIYINFDDIRFADFTSENFQDIQDITVEFYGSKAAYFLDEIQNVSLWERWVNNLYEKGVKVFITGSNSKLLSSEISTYLTGRNKVIMLQPFSFKEALRMKKFEFKQLTSERKALLFRHFKDYMNHGGFPLVVKNDDTELSKQYFEDILNKDIFARYNIKQKKEFKDLVLYIFSNSGIAASYSALKKVSGIESLSTIKGYLDYLKETFLVYSIDKFDYSVKKQKISSSKIYSSDTGFLKN